MAGVNMRLEPGAIRRVERLCIVRVANFVFSELHWHVTAEVCLLACRSLY